MISLHFNRRWIHLVKNCAICKRFDSLHVKNRVALAICLNEFVVNKAWCVQEMFLSDRTAWVLSVFVVGFFVFFETWKNMESKDLDLNGKFQRLGEPFRHTYQYRMLNRWITAWLSWEGTPGSAGTHSRASRLMNIPHNVSGYLWHCSATCTARRLLPKNSS